MQEWKWQPGNWQSLAGSGELTLLNDVELVKIGAPWALNIHNHLNYNRLFWDIWNNGLKTPLLVRPWTIPFKADRTRHGCKPSGRRLDNAPSPVYQKPPKYELVIGNMRFFAIYTQSYKTAPCLLLPESEWDLKVELLWNKYHSVFEGNYYDHPDHQGPSKYDQGF